MRLLNGELRLSASDLIRFKGCRHATTLDLRLMGSGTSSRRPTATRPSSCRSRATRTSSRFLKSCGSRAARSRSPEVRHPLERSVELTAEALRQGPDVGFQGAFLEGAWGGYSDFLERIDRPSALGDWSCEVVDTKLKRKPEPADRLSAVDGAGRRTLRASALPASSPLARRGAVFRGDGCLARAGFGSSRRLGADGTSGVPHVAAPWKRENADRSMARLLASSPAEVVQSTWARMAS